MATTKKGTTTRSNSSAKMNKSRSTDRRRVQQNNAEDGGNYDSSALLEFFTDELKDIYWAEKHLVSNLPKMKKAASSEDLQEAIEKHLGQTVEHVKRVEEVFEMLEEKAQAKKCEAMAGLVEEAKTVIDDTKDGSATRDAGIIISAQKVEHYEIAAYGGLVQLAKTLGRNDIADILESTLQEEKAADKKLSEIAETSVNAEATEESPE